MKKFAFALTLTFGLAIAGSAAADCTLKDAPPVPDGKSAAEAEMAAAQQAIKSYVAETQEFLQCLEFESKGRMSGDVTRRYNDASERMEKLAADFNKQLKAFKAK